MAARSGSTRDRVAVRSSGSPCGPQRGRAVPLSSSQIVHVIDDDVAVRQSLAFLLSTAGYAVRVHESAVAFLEALPGVRDGCVVTDIRMPGMDGLELQRQLGMLKVALPVIVITGHGDIALAVQAMKAGAVDFIEKPFDDEVLLSAIRAALASHVQDIERDSRIAEVQQRLESLSDRERDVLKGLVAGKPNKIIAYDLGISARTVEVYRANVMTKMHADSLSELVRMAILSGNAP
ncbi:MAG: response regulator transcription factor FixJ [Rhodospirillales bacterium]|nr:response regulator transcription factor FixJ [Rhodospirillales bacterium]